MTKIRRYLPNFELVYTNVLKLPSSRCRIDSTYFYPYFNSYKKLTFLNLYKFNSTQQIVVQFMQMLAVSKKSQIYPEMANNTCINSKATCTPWHPKTTKNTSKINNNIHQKDAVALWLHSMQG